MSDGKDWDWSNWTCMPKQGSHETTWPGTPGGYVSIFGTAFLLFAAGVVAWIVLASRLPKCGCDFKAEDVTRTSCKGVPSMVLAIFRTVIATFWIFYAAFRLGLEQKTGRDAAPCLHRFFTSWNMLMTISYFTISALTSWWHLRWPHGHKGDNHQCLTAMLHFLLGTGLTSVWLVVLVFQMVILPLAYGTYPLNPAQGFESYVDHVFVGVVWAIDFCLSGMPVPAVHGLLYTWLPTAYVMANLLVANMREHPPFFFLDATKPSNALYMCALWLLCFVTYYTFYGIGVCFKYPHCGCHCAKACAPCSTVEDEEEDQFDRYGPDATPRSRLTPKPMDDDVSPLVRPVNLELMEQIA